MPTGLLDEHHGALVRVVVDNPAFRKLDPHLSGDLGIGVPAPIRGWGILDTGASMSCVVGEAASTLSLLEVDAVEMRGVRAAHDETSDDFSRVRFAMVHIDGLDQPLSLQLVEVRPLGEVDGVPVLMLVGRDVLDRALLGWDGPGGRFSLTFPPVGQKGRPSSES